MGPQPGEHYFESPLRADAAISDHCNRYFSLFLERPFAEEFWVRTSGHYKAGKIFMGGHVSLPALAVWSWRSNFHLNNSVEIEVWKPEDKCKKHPKWPRFALFSPQGYWVSTSSDAWNLGLQISSAVSIWMGTKSLKSGEILRIKAMKPL